MGLQHDTVRHKTFRKSPLIDFFTEGYSKLTIIENNKEINNIQYYK